MVANLQEVFERATEKYLDQITSSDEDIAVEFQETTSRDSKCHSSSSSNVTNQKRKKPSETPAATAQKRKSTPNVQPPEKRTSIDRSPSVASRKSETIEKKTRNKTQEKPKQNVNNKVTEPPKKTNTNNNKQIGGKRGKKVRSPTPEEVPVQKRSKSPIKSPLRSKSSPVRSKSSPVRSKSPKVALNNKSPKRKSPIVEKNQKITSKNLVKTPKSPSWPPSSPDTKTDSDNERTKVKGKVKHWKEVFKDKKNNKKEEKPPKEVLKPKVDNKKEEEAKPKEKNSNLRETIEKLKAKSDLTKITKKDKLLLKEEFVKEEKKEKNPKKIVKKVTKPAPIKEKPPKPSPKEAKPKKCEFDFEDDDDDLSTQDSNYSDKKSTIGNNNKKSDAKKLTGAVKKQPKKQQNFDGLDDATEQTIKDINKWLDTAPKDHSEFSSASNSPSHFLDDLETKSDEFRKKLDKPIRKDAQKDLFKRRLAHVKDSKLVRRREVQRTIDRLQPGKSKGNLLSNIQTNKPEELFPLGPLSKLRESKNSLVVKSDDSGPKLSLGSVLDSFGKHNFSEETEKIPKLEETSPKEDLSEPVLEKSETPEPKTSEDVPTKKEEESTKPSEPPKKEVKNSATPNLSAWFKAFGAPKVQTTYQKKKPEESDVKEVVEPPPETPKPAPEPKPEEPAKKCISPEPDSPAGLGQPTPRQRRGSTGSSMSERSSFSQDMDSSPRMSMDERLGGSYPAPYPSPLHR